MNGGTPSLNPLQSLANRSLQAALNRAIAGDERNRGIRASAYHRDMFGNSTVVFNLKDLSGSQSRLDVFRVLLDFAHEIQDQTFESVELAFRGEARFKLDGSYFRTLGKERHTQNPAFTIRTFPENAKTPTGRRAFPEWEGGILGVLNKQMEDFNDLHDQWYLDAIKRSL
jgi:hypothetical protein